MQKLLIITLALVSLQASLGLITSSVKRKTILRTLRKGADVPAGNKKDKTFLHAQKITFPVCMYVCILEV